MKKQLKQGLAFQYLQTRNELLMLLKANSKATTIEEVKAINNELIRLVAGTLSFTALYLDPKGKLKPITPSNTESDKESTQD